MTHRIQLLTVFASLLLAAQAWAAEVRTNWERNQRPAAAAGFRFENVPAPSASDAAINARWTIVSGQADPNGGDLEVLSDGDLPRNEDQPAGNFFFAPGTAGGRLVLDLGRLAEVEQVNTYSWHPRARGPQVYRLYASDGSAAEFDWQAVATGDPEPSGWTQIAAIDTRSEQDASGGQYGVSISAAEGGKLGTYRYLLFDVSRTDDRDRFSNTFFSEIDVHDGREHAAEPRPYEIVFDVSEMPELQAWVDGRLRPICERWYPKIVELLPSEGRWFLYEPVSQRPRPDPARAHYTDSYRITAAFLHYVTETHDREIVRKLNAAMREGRYTHELWKTSTGKTIDELWTEYIGALGTGSNR